MADVILVKADHGLTVYVTISTSAGQTYRADTRVVEDYVSADFTATKYCIALTEQGTASGRYAVAFPALAPGVYSVIAYRQPGSAPAESDPVVATGNVEWDGATIVPLTALPDKTIRRRTANVEASGYGDALSLHSIYGMMQSAQKFAVSGTTLTVYKTDATSLGTFTLTLGMNGQIVAVA